MSDEKKTVSMPMEEYKILKHQADQAVKEAEQIQKETEEKIAQGLLCTVTHYSHGYEYTAIKEWSDAAMEFSQMQKKLDQLRKDKEIVESCHSDYVAKLLDMKTWGILRLIGWRFTK